jgi:hypothetical protein
VKALVAAVAMVIALATGVARAQPDHAPADNAAGIREAPGGAPSRTEPTAPANDSGGGTASDKRPFYVAAGIAVLAALFLWNRRKRAELEREHEDDVREHRARTRAAREERLARTDDDDDAADLRAAARNDEEPK